MRWLATFLTFALMAFAAAPASAGSRLALVIGNAKYANAPSSKIPPTTRPISPRRGERDRAGLR